jgi:ACS family glucarate transporter-like MFS transporter
LRETRPGCARTFYSWLPVSERGLAQGINFSGSRLGAALALPLIGLMIEAVGWRMSFVILGVIGLGWAVFWYVWFRDDPADHPGVSAEERELIFRTRQQAKDAVNGNSHDVSRRSLVFCWRPRGWWDCNWSTRHSATP